VGGIDFKLKNSISLILLFVFIFMSTNKFHS